MNCFGSEVAKPIVDHWANWIAAQHGMGYGSPRKKLAREKAFDFTTGKNENGEIQAFHWLQTARFGDQSNRFWHWNVAIVSTVRFDLTNKPSILLIVGVGCLLESKKNGI